MYLKQKNKQNKSYEIYNKKLTWADNEEEAHACDLLQSHDFIIIHVWLNINQKEREMWKQR